MFSIMRAATVVIVLLVLHSQALAQAVRSNGQIERIDVRLFQHHSGRLSEPLDDKAELWNTVIGKGSSREPSTSLLADVIVKGKPGALGTAISFKAVSERTGKVLAQQNKSVGVYSSDGRYHVGFWLPNTGCDPLRLTARVKGGKEVVANVPFRCGE